MNKILVLGLSSKLGCGKNFCSNVIRKMINSQNDVELAHADHFKVDCVCKLDAEYEKVFFEKDEKTRRLLQISGTEEGRDKFGPNIWANTLKTWIRVHRDRGARVFFITDVRFPNEIELLKSLEKEDSNIEVSIIRIIAPIRNKMRLDKETSDPEKQKAIANHLSETALDNYPLDHYDYVLYNDPNENVFPQIQQIASKYYEKKFNKVLFIELNGVICHRSSGEPIENSVGTLKLYQKCFDKVIIVSDDHRVDQVRKICQLGLFDFDCESLPNKKTSIISSLSKDMFTYLMNKYPSNHYTFIGNVNDVLYAHEGNIDYFN